jgi:hypothetical protein
MKLNLMGLFGQNEGVEYILPISGALEKYTIILIWEIMLFLTTSNMQIEIYKQDKD